MTYTILTSHFCLFVIFFFFKQKTAYEMRISDWSSDVCSSDLAERLRAHRLGDHHAFLDLDALQEQVRADQRTEEGAEAVEGLAERSEEHTSELQSLMRISYAVFCLKKKKTTTKTTHREQNTSTIHINDRQKHHTVTYTYETK